MAGQKKLTISPCTVQKNGKLKVDTSKKFEVLLNPADYRQGKSISYNEDKTIGQLGSDQKFNAINPETLKLSLILDGTGVLEPAGSDRAPQDVQSQFRKLNSIIYKYQGNKHEPNHVRILWGSLIFYGRLDSMSAENTLFSSQGKPIRAKVVLTFKAFISNKEASLRANKSSPDLSHIVTFAAGDTLPLLCYRIYGDVSFYAKVARANNITNFRDIKLGTRLRFPPLR
jgi:hypothetical protein